MGHKQASTESTKCSAEDKSYPEGVQPVIHEVEGSVSLKVNW